MRLFGTITGEVDRFDRADWMTPPFDLAWRASVTVSATVIRRAPTAASGTMRRGASAASDVLRRSATATSDKIRRH